MAYQSLLAIGLMSGTSADGVDAALVRTDGERVFEFLDFFHLPYPSNFQLTLLRCALQQASDTEIRETEITLTELHAAAVDSLLQQRGIPAVDLIGFHGHTILHEPNLGRTCQIGDGQNLADSTGLPVVYDFRTADMEAGGQGAPLVPLFQQMLFSNSPKPCVILNIGGVANIAWLNGDDIVSGDTGPGCGMLDAWMQSNSNQRFDTDGKLAMQGKIDQTIVDDACKQAYFKAPMPKSADRFEFDNIVNVENLSPADGAATLCAVTATTISDAVQSLGTPVTTWVTGGGSRHPLIMQLLAEQLGDVRPIEECGLRSDSMEAECFAWLAVRRLRGLPTTIPSTTGCSQPTSGGKIAEPEQNIEAVNSTR